MPENVRLIATDIEGTLVDDQQELRPGTVRVLQRLAHQGIPVVLVTGFNPWPVRRLMAVLGPRISAICLNGIFLMEGGAIQPGALVDPEVAREAARLMVDQGCAPLVYGTDGVSRYWPVSEAAMQVLGGVIAGRPYQPYQAVETLEELFAVPPAQVSACETEVRGTALRAVLTAALGERAYVAFAVGTRTWVEVNHPQARKDVALLAWAGRRGIGAESIVYFGDNLNDLEVFRRVGYPVAVANARPEIKALAWRVALSNNEEGVARMLEELFGLPLIGQGE